MVKRIILAAVVGAVVIFIQAGVFFGFLFADFLANNFPREFTGVNRVSIDYALIIIADFLYALLLAYLLSQITGPKTFRRGFIVGLIIGFAVVLHFELISTATTYLTTIKSVIANVAISSVMSGVGSGVIAVTLKKLEGTQNVQSKKSVV